MKRNNFFTNMFSSFLNLKLVVVLRGLFELVVTNSLARWTSSLILMVYFFWLNGAEKLTSLQIILSFLPIIFLFFLVLLSIQWYSTPEKKAAWMIKIYDNVSEVAFFLVINRQLSRWLKNIKEYYTSAFRVDIIEYVDVEEIREWEIEKIRPISYHRKKLNKTSNRLFNEIKKEHVVLDIIFKHYTQRTEINQSELESMFGGINLDVIMGFAKERDDLLVFLRKFFVDWDDGNHLHLELKKELITHILSIKTKIDRINKLLEWSKKLSYLPEDNIHTIFDVVRDSSTGRATLRLCRFLGALKNDNDLDFLLDFADSRKGFSLIKLIGINKNNGNPEILGYPIKKNFESFTNYINDFKFLRDNCIKNLINNINDGDFLEKEEIIKKKSIGIALTYGYSSILFKVCEEIIRHTDDVRVWIISFESTTQERTLLAHLKGEIPNLDVRILPIKSVLETGLSYLINTIFVGIEAINTEGLLVHPRGGKVVLDELRKMESKSNPIKVYAIGESFKVKKFSEYNIDYLDLFSVHPYNIDCVITDRGRYYKSREKFDLNESLKNWEDIMMSYFK